VTAIDEVTVNVARLYDRFVKVRSDCIDARRLAARLGQRPAATIVRANSPGK
jgi:hypothetical protein